MEHVCYVLYSKKHEKIYIGYTSNLIGRFKSHNELGTKGYTIRYRPWIVVHQNADFRSCAIQNSQTHGSSIFGSFCLIGNAVFGSTKLYTNFSVFDISCFSLNRRHVPDRKPGNLHRLFGIVDLKRSIMRVSLGIVHLIRSIVRRKASILDLKEPLVYRLVIIL